ncbi:hypothetical protein D3C76_1160610 [compost metagenome]
MVKMYGQGSAFEYQLIGSRPKGSRINLLTKPNSGFKKPYTMNPTMTIEIKFGRITVLWKNFDKNRFLTSFSKRANKIASTVLMIRKDTLYNRV